MYYSCDGCYMLCTLTTQDGAEEEEGIARVFKNFVPLVDHMTCPFPFKDKKAYWHIPVKAEDG